VVITTRGRLVFVAESFDVPMARKLTSLVLDAQGTGDLKMAEATPYGGFIGQTASSSPVGGSTLSGGLVHLFSSCGVMKSAVQAGLKAATY
jgi:hypothetical protein